MKRIFKPSIKFNGLSRLARWLAPRRRRNTALAVAVVIVVVAVIAITDPFAGSGTSNAGVTDNAYPTSTTTVKEGSLTQQTQESATLGYAGSTTISIPNGTTASAITEATATAQSAAEKVRADKTALANATSLNGLETNNTLTAAEAELSSDESTLAAAKRQLSSDEQLGCPAASSATVTTAGSSPSSGSPSSGSPSSGSPSSSDSSTTTTTTPSGGATGNTGVGTAGAKDMVSDQATASGAPIVTTGASSGATSTTATLSGTVDPNGLSTSYDFEYGKTTAYGSSTPSEDAGSAITASSVSANLSNLSPNTTYDFVLVATNADGTSVSEQGTFETTQSSCVAERQIITTDTQAVTEASDSLSADKMDAGSSVTADQQQLTNDEAAESSADQALATAEQQATNPASTFTALPTAGQVLDRGSSVYSLDGHPVPLFYGTETPYRALYLGVTDGPDVTELQQNLIALGFGAGISANPHFSSATEAAVKAWQASIGVPETGVVALGDIVIAPGPIEVDTVSASLGGAVQAGGAVLTATSTTPEVTIDLDADLQSEIKVNDPVTITLPNNSTTPGVVSSVGKIATAPASNAGNTGGSSSPTITVEVTPLQPKATGGLDQAPVEVSITTASVNNVLVAPIDALTALAGGGYALEEIGVGGVHHLVAVNLGLFDDAAGLVQVSGSGVAAGQRVVIPNT